MYDASVYTAGKVAMGETMAPILWISENLVPRCLEKSYLTAIPKDWQEENPRRFGEGVQGREKSLSQTGAGWKVCSEQALHT